MAWLWLIPRGKACPMPRIASFALHKEAPDPGVCVIAVEGEADMSTAVKFNESFFEAARSGLRGVIADLSEVDFVDSSMLNALVVSHRRMARDKGRFAVVSRNEQVRRVLEVTGLGHFLSVFDTRDAALAHVRGG
jgi:anti-sigma B factor antagonist